MNDPEMERLMQRAKRLEKKVAQVKRELSGRVFEGTVKDLVVARVNGQQEVVSLDLTPTALEVMNHELLPKQIVAALNDALGTSKRVVEEEMSRATRDMNLPGLG